MAHYNLNSLQTHHTKSP